MSVNGLSRLPAVDRDRVHRAGRDREVEDCPASTATAVVVEHDVGERIDRAARVSSRIPVVTDVGAHVEVRRPARSGCEAVPDRGDEPLVRLRGLAGLFVRAPTEPSPCRYPR